MAGWMGFLDRFGSRRTLVGLHVLAVMLMVVPAGAQPVKSLTKLTVGYSMLNADSMALYVAKERGLFRNYGLDVDLTFIPGGREHMQSIVAGSVAIGSSSGPIAIQAVAGEADAVIILGFINRFPYHFWASSRIRRPEDLKGKRVAISGFGAASHAGVLFALKQMGLDPKRDGITVVVIGPEPQRLAALRASGVDGTVLTTVFAPVAREAGLTLLADLTKLTLPWQHTALVTTKRYLRSQPQIVEGVLEGILEGYAYVLDPQNQRFVLRTIASYLKFDRVEQAEDGYKETLAMYEKKPYPSVEGVRNVIEFLKETDERMARVRPEDAVDLGPMRKLDRAGFIDRLYAKKR